MEVPHDLGGLNGRPVSASGTVAIEPFANLAYVNVHTNGFSEQGGASTLTVYGGSNDSTFTTLGFRASSDLDIGAARATVRGMIGWRHAYGDVTPTVSQAFTGVAPIPLLQRLRQSSRQILRTISEFERRQPQPHDDQLLRRNDSDRLAVMALQPIGIRRIERRNRHVIVAAAIDVDLQGAACIVVVDIAGTYRDIFVGAVGAPQKAVLTAARQSVIQPCDHAGRGV